MRVLRTIDYQSEKGRLLLLGMGVLLIFFTRERWAVHLLAWMAPVPFLIYLRTAKGWRSTLLFVGVFCLANVLGAAKSFTPPWPGFMALAFGIPMGLVLGSGYLLWNRLRAHIPQWLGNLAFAAAMVTAEWLLYRFTPYGTVGAAANTQLDNLPLLQTASLWGVGGLGFLIHWVAAIAAAGICEKRLPRKQTLWVIGMIVVAHVWGAWRIGTPVSSPSATVAAVQTDFDWFATPDIPSVEERKKFTNRLFDRTVIAARRGAQMVVWNEIANMIDPPDEQALLERATALSRTHRIHLVMSYLKLLSVDPLRWENKYVWTNPKGEMVDTYLKHKPAKPVEPAVEGKGVPRVANTGFGSAAGAICFDFDFPQIALALAKGGADFVFVPGADSFSLDPYHTQIAALRAIEGGYSVIRSARHGTSAGIDPYGRIQGRLSANESDEKILLVTIPTRAVWTLYKATGDWPAWLSMLLILCLTGRQLFRAVRKGQHKKQIDG